MPNPKSKHSPKSKPSPQSKPRSKTKIPAPPLRTRFSASQLLSQFRKLLPASVLASWLAPFDQLFYLRAFTPLITLWYCVFQRLHYNHPLSAVVEDARAGGADRLSPRGKALSRQLQSEATASFSDARQRLPLVVFQKTLWHTATQIAASVKAALWFGLNVALVDGSTNRMRPFGDIPKHFPAHRPGNCKKQPYWCVARVVGMVCLATGAVLDSAMGSLKASEQALCALLLKRPWKKWLLVGDRNFGVYSVARSTLAAHAQALLRMTKARATKLARSVGTSLTDGLDLLVTWHPSSHDQCPEGLEATPVPGRLLVIRCDRPGFRQVTLYLFTTLVDQKTYSAEALAKLYGQRWQIELSLRYIKAQMDLGFLECRSAEMARKTWLSGLIAYNVIRWTMAAAAALAEIPVQILSFSRARELLLGWCLRSSVPRPSLRSWKRLLSRIAKARLPKRRNPRPSEPRAIREFHSDFAKLKGSRQIARQKLAETYANS